MPCPDDVADQNLMYIHPWFYGVRLAIMGKEGIRPYQVYFLFRGVEPLPYQRGVALAKRHVQKTHVTEKLLNHVD